MNKYVPEDLLLSTLPPQQPMTRWTDDPLRTLPTSIQQGGVEIISPISQGALGPREFGGVNFVPITNQRYQLRQRQQNRLEYTVVKLVESVHALLNDMEEIKSSIFQLQAKKTFVVPITTLAPEPIQMRLNIPATIEGDGEDFTASFTEANVSASGETEADAIANLKGAIASTFEFLESLPENERGPLPARQWEILRNVLTR
jgi:predicted RNase H-like HicB family nuclease